MDDKETKQAASNQKKPGGKTPWALSGARKVTFNHHTLAQQIQVEAKLIPRLSCSQRTGRVEKRLGPSHLQETDSPAETFMDENIR